MTKMAAMAINSKKTFKNLQKAYDFETWHEAAGNRALQSCVNHVPGMTLTYFTTRST